MTSSVRPLPRPQAGSIASANRSAQAVFLSCTCRESFTGVWNQYIAIGRRLGRIGGMGAVSGLRFSRLQDFKISRFQGSEVSKIQISDSGICHGAAAKTMMKAET